jgi:hypothetical protein
MLAIYEPNKMLHAIVKYDTIKSYALAASLRNSYGDKLRDSAQSLVWEKRLLHHMKADENYTPLHPQSYNRTDFLTEQYYLLKISSGTDDEVTNEVFERFSAAEARFTEVAGGKESLLLINSYNESYREYEYNYEDNNELFNAFYDSHVAPLNKYIPPRIDPHWFVGSVMTPGSSSIHVIYDLWYQVYDNINHALAGLEERRSEGLYPTQMFDYNGNEIGHYGDRTDFYDGWWNFLCNRKFPLQNDTKSYYVLR